MLKLAGANKPPQNQIEIYNFALATQMLFVYVQTA